MEPPSRSRRCRLYTFIILLNLISLGAAQTASSGVPYTQIVVLLALFILSGLMSGSETALTAIGEWKIRQLREDGLDPNGVFAMLERDRTRFITTLLIGNNLVNIAATALVTQIAINLSRSLGFAQTVAVGSATAIMTILVLIFGEITPKSIAVHNAVPFARAVIRPVHWLSMILYPIGLFFTFITSSILRLFRLEPRDNPLITSNELRLMLRSAEEQGVIEEQEQEMIKNIIELEETVVREVMTPRVDITAIAEDATLEELVALNEEKHFSRMPVYEESVDNIRGVVYTRDLLKYLGKPEVLGGTTVSTLMTAPQYVPETLSILQLLRDMRARKNHLAIVVDEFGGTAGLVTLEDIIEEVTGEIYDETDIDEEEEIKQVGESFQIQGVAHLDAVAETLLISFEDEGDYDTLAGFLTSEFGYIPQSGETLEHESVRFTVEDADERRILSVLATSVSKEALEQASMQDTASDIIPADAVPEG